LGVRADGVGLGGTQIPTLEVEMSATDKMKNAVQDVEGKAKEAMGRASGDHSKEAEGRTDQTKSDLKDAGEKVKDAFKH
jgi:uncharacterized protein YjbJ (UPF0337 family)